MLNTVFKFAWGVYSRALENHTNRDVFCMIGDQYGNGTNASESYPT